jgi:hypothetical protein
MLDGSANTCGFQARVLLLFLLDFRVVWIRRCHILVASSCKLKPTHL